MRIVMNETISLNSCKIMSIILSIHFFCEVFIVNAIVSLKFENQDKMCTDISNGPNFEMLFIFIANFPLNN